MSVFLWLRRFWLRQSIMAKVIFSLFIGLSALFILVTASQNAPTGPKVTDKVRQKWLLDNNMHISYS